MTQKQITFLTLSLFVAAGLLVGRVDAQQMDHGAMTVAATPVAAPPGAGERELAKIQGLIGTWDAPMGGKTMTDVFKPFAFGTAVLGEEWLDGKQITATVFYVANGELRADHYCDYLNQPRYAAKASADPAVIDLEFREATNLEAHPAHFHSTTWKIVDATHLIQDWHIVGGKKPDAVAHLEFVKRAAPAA
jgi:hypothetical protein